jgi:hypothetical protein
MEYFTICMILTIIVTCTFLAELEVHERIFGSYMRTRDMEDSQGSYNHEDEVRGLHVNMGNAETESNGRRSRVELVELDETMRSLQREVQSYREDNERMMRAQEEFATEFEYVAETSQ